MKKYEMIPDESGLYRIRALIDIPRYGVKAGDYGGFVETEDNLSQEDDAWITGDARITDNAQITGDALIGGNAWITGDARITGDAIITATQDYIVFKNFWSSGRYFTWTRSNNMWSVGCFYGAGDELIKKAYADSERSGREYERVVKYVESILEDEKNDKKTAFK